MSVIRVGSTGKYADGWEQIFGGAGGRSGKPRAKKAKGKAKKATASKATAPKAAKKKSKSRGR